MRVLILDDEIRQRVRDHATWANQRENWYDPSRDTEPPGDNPAFVLMLEQGYRAVYTMTLSNGKAYRHLTVSVEGPKYPHEIAVFTIASLLGFTGGTDKDGFTVKPGPWAMTVNEQEHCVVVAQEKE